MLQSEFLPGLRSNDGVRTMNEYIDKQAVIDRAVNFNLFGKDEAFVAVSQINYLPTYTPKDDVIHCKDCKWWNRDYDSKYGYCEAAKHCHMSEHWDIAIYRTYKEDFFCGDAPAFRNRRRVLQRLLPSV